MLEDKLRLKEQADSLEQRLEAVLHDKFHAKAFDAQTPIDKTLAYLQNVIKVTCEQVYDVAVSRLTSCTSFLVCCVAWV